MSVKASKTDYASVRATAVTISLMTEKFHQSLFHSWQRSINTLNLTTINTAVTYKAITDKFVFYKFVHSLHKSM